MLRRLCLVTLFCCGLIGSGRAETPSAEAEGRRWLAHFQCNRCHDGSGLPDVPQEKHCTHCHQEILAGTFRIDQETLHTWQSHLTSLNVVPSLTGIGVRLRRSWVESFLLKPHDLRPALPALMPRLAITPPVAKQLAAALIPKEAAPTPLPKGNLSQGRLLFESLGCATCHRFSGVPPLAVHSATFSLSAAQLQNAIALAPDLRFARERLQTNSLASWLRNPKQQKPDTLMPSFALSDEQVSDLSAFLLTTPLLPQPQPPPFVRLPVLTRRVGFEEVNERVFRRICWHCHSTPEYAKGDGGPGNTGGFGFQGRGFSVTSYADVASGVLDDKRNRRSVFLPVSGPESGTVSGPDKTPRLVAVLLARHKELAGQVTPGLRGMPLGLPALSAEQIQLVESWIAQGRPQ
jgi:cytochrome c2